MTAAAGPGGVAGGGGPPAAGTDGGCPIWTSWRLSRTKRQLLRESCHGFNHYQPHTGVVVSVRPASITETMVRATRSLWPAGFDGDGTLYGLNLFLMTAFTCLGLMLAGRMARAAWRDRGRDRLRHPIGIWRLGWAIAGLAVCLRCGAEAANLWAWNPADPVTTARVLMAKRWVDPAALVLAAGWMTLVTLADAGMAEQLLKRPYPVNMWASLPALRRPAAVLALSLVAAVGVAWTR